MKEGGFNPRSLQYRQKASTVPADSVCSGRHSRDMLANPRRALGGTQGSQGEAETLSLRFPTAPSLLHYNGLEMHWKLLKPHWNLNKSNSECLIKTSVNI